MVRPPSSAPARTEVSMLRFLRLAWSPQSAQLPLNHQLDITFTKKVTVLLTVARNGFSFKNATAIWVKRRFTQHEIFGRNSQNGAKKHYRRLPRRQPPIIYQNRQVILLTLAVFVPHGEDSISPNSTVWLCS